MKHENNTSQQHGTDFENLVKTMHMFPGACNETRNVNDKDDIAAKHDKKFGLATSVKAVKENGIIGLADAIRFYEINAARRFIIGEWVQANEEEKHFVRIHEFIIPYGLLREIRGEILVDQIKEYHMRIAECEEGKAGATIARAARDRILEYVEGKTGIVRLNFKIDDYKQRRLQLTIGLADLIEATRGKGVYSGFHDSQPIYTLHQGRMCQYRLPFVIFSPSRRIEKSSTETMDSDEDRAMLIPFEDAPIITRPAQRDLGMRRTPQRLDDKQKREEEADEGFLKFLWGEDYESQSGIKAS
jgi:hypothetical protein